MNEEDFQLQLPSDTSPDANPVTAAPTRTETLRFALTDRPSGESDEQKAIKAEYLGRTYFDLLQKAQRGIDPSKDDNALRAEAVYFTQAMTGQDDVYGRLWKKGGFKTGREYLEKMHDFFLNGGEKNMTPELKEFQAKSYDEQVAEAMEKRKTLDALKHAVGYGASYALDWLHRADTDKLASEKALQEDIYKRQVRAEYAAKLLADNAWHELSAIMPSLSADGQVCAKALMDSKDNKLPESLWAKFNNLGDQEKAAICRVRTCLAPRVEGSFLNTIGDMAIGAANVSANVAAAPYRFGNKIGMMLSNEAFDAGFDVNELARRRQYLWQATGSFLAGGAEGGYLPQMQFEQICQEHGFLAESLIGAVSTLPYMAAAAVPYIGVATVATEAMSEMDDHVAMAGGDITDPDYMRSSALFGAMYAYTERLQVDGLLGAVGDRQLREAMLKGFWSGVKDRKAIRTLTAGTLAESLQEGLQNGIMAANEALALDQDATKAFAEGFTEDFVNSLGTMLVVEGGSLGFAHWKRSGFNNPFSAAGREAGREARSVDLETEYEKNMSLDRMVDFAAMSKKTQEALLGIEAKHLHMTWRSGGKDALIKAGIDPVRAEEWDYFYSSTRREVEMDEETGEAAPDIRSDKAEADIKRYVAHEAAKHMKKGEEARLAAFDLAMTNLDWVRSAWSQGAGVYRTDEKGKVQDPGQKALEELGFSKDVAKRLSEYFHYERSAAYSPAALNGIKARYDERMEGKVTAKAALARQFGGQITTIDGADYMQFTGKDGISLVRIDETPGGIDFAEASEGVAVDVERATDGEVTKQQWMDATEDERKKIWKDYDLRHEGSFRPTPTVKVTLPADPSVGVDSAQAATVVGAISLDSQTDNRKIADTSAAFHEVYHAFSSFAQASGLWTKEDAAFLEKKFGKPKYSTETHDEEAAAEGFRSFLARRANGALTVDDEKSPFMKIYAAAAGLDATAKERAAQEKVASENEKAFFDQLIAEANKPKPKPPAPKPDLPKTAAPQKGITPAQPQQQTTQPPPPQESQQTQVASVPSVPSVPDTAQAQPGAPRTWSAYTPTGNVKVSGHWAVLDLKDVVHSNNPLYAVHMRAQLRNRKDNKAEEDTRKDIVNNFQGERLLDAPDTANGAPIVFYDDDGTGVKRAFVLSGNGRVLVLNELAERHLYDHYRNVMKKWAAANGIAVPDGQTPILVRVIDDYGGATRDKVADLSNTNSIQQYTEEEQARADAEVIKALGLARLYQANVDGTPDMTPGANDEFFSEFIRGVGDTSLYNSDRSLTQTARDRAQRALLAIAVGQGDRGRDVVKKLVEQTETLGIQRQKNAAAIMAAPVAALESNATYAIGPDVSRAMADFMDYAEKRRAGKVGTFKEYFDQMDLLDAPSHVARELLSLLGSDKSASTIAEYVKAYCKAAAMEDPSGNLWGAARTKDEIWNDAAKLVDDTIAKQQGVEQKTQRATGGEGGSPATRAEVMAAQRVNPAGGVRFSVDPAKVRPATKEEYDAALSTWGDMKIDAGNVASAGWIFPDGRVLKPKMQRTAFGMTPHHDSLFAFLKRPERSNDVEKFEYGYADSLAGGAVRLNLGNGGIEVMRLPTAEQLDTLYDALDAGYGLMEDEGEDVLRVDVDRENGSTAFTAQYRRGTSARRIMDDLREWFESAKVPDAAANARFSISGIYTGSAADYDKPSLHYVGSGEGSQVYGWGLYGSNVRGVAESYAASAKRDKAITQDEETFQAVKKVLGKSVSEDILQAIYEGVTGNSDWGEVKAWIKRDAEWDDEIGPEMLSVFRKKESELKKVHEQYAAREQIYEQTWFTNREPGDESHLLKWYEPVSEEQKRWIVELMENEGQPEKSEYLKDVYSHLRKWEPTGENVYGFLTRGLGSQKAASEFLYRAGIDGVKYPVDSFGAKTVKNGDEAGWNYVAFSDENIRVDHKWTDGKQRYSIATLGRYNTDDLRKLAHRVKKGDSAAIADAGRRLAKILPKNAVLVPMPSRTGESTTMRALADAIAANADGVTVVDALRSNPHESSYERKKRGDEPEEVEMRRVAEIPKGREVYVVDNVIDTGATYGAAVRAIRNANILVLADTDKTPGELFNRAPTVVNPDVQVEKESAEQRYSVFAGEKTATPRLLKPLAEAKAMLGDGQYTDAVRREIYDKTGWWQGKDSKWRVELPNLKAKYFDADESIEFADADVILEKYGWNEYSAYWLRDLVTFPKGLKANTYELGETLVFFVDEEQMKSASGGEDASAATFVRVEQGLLGPQVTCEIHVLDPMAEERERKGRQRLAQSTLDSLTHELQHVIQLREGFAFGGNTADAGGDRVYGAAAGEVEARNAARRNDPENRARPPWATEDVPARYQSVGYSGWEWTKDNGWQPMEQSVALSPASMRSAAETVPHGRNKVAGVVYPDAGGEIENIRFSIGAKRREEYGRILAKHRPDLRADAILDELDKYDNPKKEKLTLHWIVRGTIWLPNDESKVDQAIEVAEKARVDPFKYASPLALIDAHSDIHPTEKRIDPATVPELTDARDEGDGVVSYQVQDNRAGQAAMRRIIDTHWGEDANPWCLLARDTRDPELSSDFWEWMRAINGGRGEDAVTRARDKYFESPDEFESQYKRVTGRDPRENPDELTAAWGYWQKYNALPKRVAFKDGKLLAFMATEGMDEDRAFDDAAYGGGSELARRLPDLYAEYEQWQESEEGQNEGANFYQWLDHEHYDELREFLDNPSEEWWDRQDESHIGHDGLMEIAGAKGGIRYSISSDLVDAMRRRHSIVRRRPTTADIEEIARRAIRASIADGGAEKANDALVEYVAYFKLSHKPIPRPQTIAKLGLAMGMKAVEPKRILKDAEKLAQLTRGTIIESASLDGNVAIAMALMKREENLDKKMEDIIARSVAAGGELTHKGVGQMNSIINRRVDSMMREMTAASLADLQGDTGIDIAAEIIENNPDAFDTEYRRAKKAAGEAEDGGAENEASTDGQAAPDRLPIDESEMSDADRYKREVLMKEAAERVLRFIEAAKKRAEENGARAAAARERRRVVELQGGGEGGGEASPDVQAAPGGSPYDDTAPKDVKANFKTPEEFAAFLRVWARDKYAKTHGLKTLGQAEQDRLFAEFYRICVRKELQDLADKLLAPKVENSKGELVTNQRLAKIGNGARVWVNRRIADLEKGMRPDTIERASADIFAFINKAAIRVSRVDLITNFKKDLKERFLGDPEFDELKLDTERKLTGWLEEATIYICKVCTLSKRSVNGDPSQLEEEYKKLHDIIDKREKIYDESGRDVADAAKKDAETRRAQWKLGLLDKYGAMASKMPGEILDLRNAAFDYLENEAQKLEDSWKQTREEQDRIRRDFSAAIVGPGDQRYDEKKHTIGGWISNKFFDSLNGMIRLRLEHLTRFASAEARAKAKDAINSMLVMLGDGEVAYTKALQADREAFFAGLAEIFKREDGKPDARAIRKYLERMDEPIPVELSRQLSNQGFAESMTYGQMLQLLVSLEQRSFKDTIEANGREGQAELIRTFRYRDENGNAVNAFTKEDDAFVDMLRAFYAAKRDQLSEVTERMIGQKVDSPDPLYCPIRRWMDDKARDLHSDPTQRWDPISKIFSRRVPSTRDFDESRTIVGLFFENSKESAKLTAWAERGSFIRNVVTSVPFQSAVNRAFGPGELSKILKQLEATFNGGEQRSQTPGEVAAADKAVNFTTYAYLGFNPLSALKQTTSIAVWANQLPNGFGDLWRHMTHFDKKVLKHLKESDEYKVRYGNAVGSGMDYATKGVNMNPSQNAVVRALSGAGMWMLKRGDFIPGGWIAQGVYKDLLDKHLKEGMGFEDADRLSITETFNMLEETQQSGRTYNTNMLQIEHGRIGRLLTQFATSPLQQLQYETQAWREWRDMKRYNMGKERIAEARAKFRRAVVINHVIIPAALNLVIAMYKAALGEEPPWEKDGYHWSLLIDVLLGQFSRLFFIGAFSTATLNALLKRETPRYGQVLPIESTIGTAATGLFLLHDLATMNVDKLQKDIERAMKSTAPTRLPYNIYRRVTGDSDQDRKRKKQAGK